MYQNLIVCLLLLQVNLAFKLYIDAGLENITSLGDY